MLYSLAQVKIFKEVIKYRSQVYEDSLREEEALPTKTRHKLRILSETLSSGKYIGPPRKRRQLR